MKFKFEKKRNRMIFLLSGGHNRAVTCSPAAALPPDPELDLCRKELDNHFPAADGDCGRLCRGRAEETRRQFLRQFTLTQIRKYCHLIYCLTKKK